LQVLPRFVTLKLKVLSMKQIKEYEKDISSIRSIMERSVKFISLSGLSGVLAGVYALIGSGIAYSMVQYPRSPFQYRTVSVNDDSILMKLMLLAAVILVFSIVTALILSQRKAKRHNLSLWNDTSRRLLINMSIPLVAGGLFILIMLNNEHYGIAAPASLIFYGLALLQASQQTYDEIRYLGLSEIIIGLLATLLPGYGLLFWALGFGVLHIIYGGLMYFRYEQ
jgi:hypothetical protein